ncbi:MAG: hypothetical protein R3D55_26295 [Chloroflexota bacterium]
MDGKRRCPRHSSTQIRQQVTTHGLDSLSPRQRFRRLPPHELAAALNRLRTLQTKKVTKET